MYLYDKEKYEAQAYLNKQQSSKVSPVIPRINVFDNRSAFFSTGTNYDVREKDSCLNSVTDINYNADKRMSLVTASNSNIVQKIKEDELSSRATAIEELINSGIVPQEGTNMWKIYHEKSNTEIHLLGTMHTFDFGKLKNGKQIFKILKGTKYSHIYSELEMDVSKIKIDDDMEQDMEIKNSPQEKKPEKEDPDYKDKIRAYFLYNRFLQNREPLLRQGIIDEMYIAIAATYSELEKKSIGLENEYIREAANKTNLQELKKNMYDIPRNDRDEEAEYVLSGNQIALFNKMLIDMKQGNDIENVEERNNRWFENKKIYSGDKQLWVIGCKHLAGLITLFSKEGWKVSPLQSLEE